MIVSTDYASLLARLDRADALPGAAELRHRTYELLRCGRGDRVADVGCGGGLAVAELTARGVDAVGVDSDPGMLAAARQRRPGAEFLNADVTRLPFPGGALRGYRADKVLHELADPGAAVAEARRVLAAGGRIVLCGQDWDTFVLDSDRPALTRTIVHARADTVAGPRAARQYRTLLVDAGFTEIAVEVRTLVNTDGVLLPMLTGLATAARVAGAVSASHARDWLAEQETRAAAGRFFLAIPMFLASATAPDHPQ